MTLRDIHIHYSRHGLSFITVADLPDGDRVAFDGFHLPRATRRRALASFRFC